uniref:Uncharacterized protein n=1 Tax=Arundo donax TaxID=35708 RepID=A0A0A8YEM0_ARUDO
MHHVGYAKGYKHVMSELVGLSEAARKEFWMLFVIAKGTVKSFKANYLAEDSNLVKR